MLRYIEIEDFILKILKSKILKSKILKSKILKSKILKSKILNAFDETLKTSKASDKFF